MVMDKFFILDGLGRTWMIPADKISEVSKITPKISVLGDGHCVFSGSKMIPRREAVSRRQSRA